MDRSDRQECFQVNVVNLEPLRERVMAEELDRPYFVALQGAARNARIAACDQQGSILGCVSVGPLALKVNRHFREDLSAAFQMFAEELGLASTARLAQRTNRACVAMSGVFQDGESYAIRQALKDIGFVGPFTTLVCEDVLADLAAAGLAEGIIVAASTGANVLVVQTPTRLHKVGGWGSGLSDWGSGYNIGISALRYCLDDYDGRRKVSPAFVNGVLEMLRLSSPQQLVAWYHAVQETSYWRSKIADLAIPIVRLGEIDGDAIACLIVEESADELVRSAQAALNGAARKGYMAPDVPIDLVVTGGVGLASSIYWKRLQGLTSEPSASWPALRIRKATFHPVIGALSFALANAESLPPEGIFRNLTRQASRIKDLTFEECHGAS